VTGFTSGPAARAAGVRYFVLTGGTAASRGGHTPPALARWVRRHGSPLADLSQPEPGAGPAVAGRRRAAGPGRRQRRGPRGAFSNVEGSACGGHRLAAERFGRPLGVPTVLPDGAVRQPFERVVFELPPAAARPG
jgi:hypothetical protein